MHLLHVNSTNIIYIFLHIRRIIIYMKKFFLVFSLLFLFFTSSNALANTSKCELNLNNFTKYKSNLIKCLDNENLELNEKISKKIDKLSIEKSNYF